jgi:hypothetical protein
MVPETVFFHPRRGLLLLDDEEGAFGVCGKSDEINVTIA